MYLNLFPLSPQYCAFAWKTIVLYIYLGLTMSAIYWTCLNTLALFFCLDVFMSGLDFSLSFCIFLLVKKNGAIQLIGWNKKQHIKVDLALTCYFKIRYFYIEQLSLIRFRCIKSGIFFVSFYLEFVCFLKWQQSNSLSIPTRFMRLKKSHGICCQGKTACGILYKVRLY